MEMVVKSSMNLTSIIWYLFFKKKKKEIVLVILAQFLRQILERIFE